MPTVSNLLGIDFGSKRVGLALVTEGEQPCRLLTLPNDPGLMTRIQEQVTAHQAATVVVGLPRNLDGEDTAQTRLVRDFVAGLQLALPKTALHLQDEALTSEVAAERLASAGITDKALVDQEAAVIILEDYVREHD